MSPSPSPTELPGRRLLLDAAFLPIQAGYLEDGRLVSVHPAEGEALHAIFDAAEMVLENRGLGFRDLDGFLYCTGPGSILALRLAAMAIEGWRGSAPASDVSIFQYYSLHAAAAMHEARGGGSSFDLFLPVRRDCLCHLPVRSGKYGELALADPAAVPPSGFPQFALAGSSDRLAPPASLPLVDYNLLSLPRDWFTGAALHRVENPTPFVPSPAIYSAWSGQRHRR
ncbi:MAG: hypothetical protein JJT96_11235 [Opitutales bacterium]|nr:hypothetical protein [Opitutales bacterium]